MTKTVLLPSASLVPIGLQAEFGAIASAMVPLNGRPALRYVADSYQRLGYDVVLAIHDGGQQVREYVEGGVNSDITLVDVGETRSLGETIATAIDVMDPLPDELVINFADTFMGDRIERTNTVCYVSQSNTYRWTTFDLTDEQRIENIRDKDREKNERQVRPIFIGVFSIGEVSLFREELAAKLGQQGEIDPFYRALQAYFNKLGPTQKCFQQAKQWWDFGHLDTYYNTKRQLFKSERFFNRITIDSDRGVLRKESEDTEKLESEIRWYLQLPKPLQHLCPRVFDYSLDGDAPFLDIEFYGYPALNDLYLFGALDIGAWARIFETLEALMATLQSYPLEAPGEGLVRAMKQMYENKTVDRLRSVMADPRLDRFKQRQICINGVECDGLSEVLATLPDVISAAGLYENASFCIVHGDLCLSNILYDPRNGIIRLVDPRGSFGDYDIYGDSRYDRAKLRHSMEGDYDFYVNGLFSLEWTDADSLVVRPGLSDRHRQIKRIFQSRFQDDASTSLQVRLVESLLFLSMIPLHKDRPRSQEALLARGLLSFQEVVSAL